MQIVNIIIESKINNLWCYTVLILIYQCETKGKKIETLWV